MGIKHIKEAIDLGERADLDLVEVAPNADPPVVRMMDYGKFKYQKEQARKAARKKQVNVNVREIKLRPKIGDHDFNTKRGHVERFLRGGDKVKVTIMFRGREVQHPELGERLLRRLAADLDELGRIESQPNLDGRNMMVTLTLSPPRRKRSTWPRLVLKSWSPIFGRSFISRTFTLTCFLRAALRACSFWYLNLP